jgi:polyhydroxyalkanoate synthase subunit PhaC
MTATDPTPLPNLPMHLLLTLGCWLSSPFALRCAKSAFPSLNSSVKDLSGLNPMQESQFQEALHEEAKSRASSFLSGILRYVESPYEREVSEPQALWRKGNARLLDYGSQGKSAGDDRPVVLFVPSLINRYYILDLKEESSFLRYAAQQGLYPLVLDWGMPGALEQDFGCGDYITEILCPALEYVARLSGQRVVLAGYCMGGVLALAAARLKKKQVAGLALLATPWDFYCSEFSPFVVDPNWRPTMEALLASHKHLPADIIQSLFYLTDPWVFEQKFRRFASLQPESRAARDFIALEHWVNDGVPMTARVARESLLDWAQMNMLARGQWKVGGKTIHPGSIDVPTLIAIPRNDHVVPRGCAMPLAEAMPQAEVIHPGAGHVGMIVGSSARRELWQPFVDWVSGLNN